MDYQDFYTSLEVMYHLFHSSKGFNVLVYKSLYSKDPGEGEVALNQKFKYFPLEDVKAVFII